MLSADMIGWIGNVFYITGAILIAKKKGIPGQSCNIMGGFLYGTQGFMVGLTSLIAIEIFLVTINAVGVWNWRRKR